MSGATLRSDDANVRDSAADCKPATTAPALPDRPVVRWFSRHPEWFRHAVWDALIYGRPRVPSTGKRLAPYEAHVIATVVLATDLWGWTWGQSSKWLSAITGISPERCRLAMKAGVELGVFLRDRIARGGRFPYRPSGKEGWRVPAVPGEGQDAPFGGYLYRVSHAWKWGITPANRRVGDFRIAIQLDRYPGSPSLLTDQDLLRRSKKRSRASLRAAVESDDLACSRELAPSAAIRPPVTETIASETPRASSASGASPHAEGPALAPRASPPSSGIRTATPERDPHEGGWPHDGRAGREPRASAPPAAQPPREGGSRIPRRLPPSAIADARQRASQLPPALARAVLADLDALDGPGGPPDTEQNDS